MAFTIYWTQRENVTSQNNFFWKSKKKSRKVQSHFLLLSFRFGFMRPQTFELTKKYVFSQITFFRKVRDTNIHSESFLKFYSAHFAHKSTYIRIFFFVKKKFQLKNSKKKNFLTFVDLYTKMCRIKFCCIWMWAFEIKNKKGKKNFIYVLLFAHLNIFKVVIILWFYF